MAKKNEPISLIPTKPKAFFFKKSREHKINFSKLQVRKQVTSKVRLGNGHNHKMLIIKKPVFLLN